eukprot:226690_1
MAFRFNNNYIIQQPHDDSNEPHTPSSESDSHQDNAMNVQMHGYNHIIIPKSDNIPVNTVHHSRKSGPANSLPCTPCSDSDSEQHNSFFTHDNPIHFYNDHETDRKLDDADSKRSYKQDHFKPSKQFVDMHVPSFISIEFIASILHRDVKDKNVPHYYSTLKGEQYVSCYIYYIKFEEDPYRNTPIGIMTPKPIPAAYLPSITFSVQTRKDEEMYWKQLINDWVANNRKPCDYVQFDRKHIHTTMISLHCVKSKGNATEHKLKMNAFGMIEQCNTSIFQRLYQWTLGDAVQQKRFYYICPLKETFSGLDDMEIHYQYVERICLGNKRLNAKQFRKALKTHCNLKNEVVEIEGKKKKKQLAISYGVDKQKFNRIREKRDVVKDDDDAKSVISIASLISFPESILAGNVDKVKQINKEKLCRKAPTLDIMLARQEIPAIENVLVTATDKDITGFDLQWKMIYPTINNVFPTGITTNLWYKLKTLPAILYRIETKLNVIDCTSELLPCISCMEQKDDEAQNEMNSVLALLFEGMHRSPLTTKKNYEILNYFGSIVLKFESILHSFITNPMKKSLEMHYDLIEHSHKRRTRKYWNLFLNAAQKAQLSRFAVFNDFDYGKWNPPQFTESNHDSLYSIPQCNDVLQSELLQTVIGATFIGLTQHNELSFAMNESLTLLKHLKIIQDPNIEYIVCDTDVSMEMNHEVVELQMKLKGMMPMGELEMNDMLQKSLKTVVDGIEYSNDGITFDRLYALGDGVQELIVGFKICNSLISHLFGKQVSTNNTGKEIWIKHFNFSEYITEKRDMLVNNKYLGYQFVKEGLDEYISWFDQNTRAKIRKLENNTETPGAHVDAHTVSVLANCAKCYKAFVGAIFVGSNPDIFKTEAPVSWKIHHCDQFIKHMLSGSTYDQMMSIELSELN